MKLFMKLFRYAGYILFRPVWWLERLLPRSKNIWVFGAWYGQKYSDNSKWLYEYVLEHNPEIKAVWITKSRAVYEKLSSLGKPVAMSSSFAGVLACLRTKYAFLTSGVSDVNKLFLNGCRQIWLWHGMPLKKIGFCDDSVVATPKWKRNLSTVLNPYSALKPYCTLSSADFFISFLSESFHLSEENIWKTGLPRCDAFFTERTEPFNLALRSEFPLAKIFLYMPTFRMSSHMDGTPFSPFTAEFGFDEQEFSAFLAKENIVFLYKPHFVDSAVKVSVRSPRFRIVSDNDFDDLYVFLNSVDALLTDYSSVYFDFLATRKPVFLLPFDYELYTKNSRSHFFNMFEEMHGEFCKNWHEFYEKSSSCQGSTKSDVNLEQDRVKFAEYLDGNSCRRLVEKVRGE